MPQLTLNPLPVPTWNRLKLNQTTVSLPPFEGDEPGAPPRLSHIQTGMGASFASLFKKAGQISCASGQTKSETMVISSGRQSTEIEAGEQSDLTVFQLIQSDTPSACLTRLRLKNGAKVQLIQVELLPAPGVFYNDIGAECGENAHFQLVQLFLGSGDIYAGARAELCGRGSDFDAAVGFYAKGQRQLDMNYIAAHTAPKTRSQMDAKGVLMDSAQKLFRGTIDFQKGSSGAVGAETEDILMLGDTAENRTVPLILCAEEDVVGSHGASIGRPNEDVLFYLESRGLDFENATRLLGISKLGSICSRIADAKAKQQAQQYLAEVMCLGGMGQL